MALPPAAPVADAVRRLARAVWPNHQPARTFMAMYSAYYDASGSEATADAPLVVAGLLSTSDRWSRLEHAWARVLRAFDVPYLQMREFAHSTGPFAGWREDEARRRQFLSRLLPVLERGVQRAFVFHLVPQDYEAVDARYDLSITVSDGSRAGAYGFSNLQCVQMVADWQEQHFPKHRLQHVVESGDRGQAILRWVGRQRDNPRQLRLSVEPAFDPVTGEYFVPFQAADLVAYEWRTHLLRRRDPSRPPRELHRLLEHAVPTTMATIGAEQLLKMCREHPEEWPRRSGSP